jgi:hypothetical protein
VRLGADPSSATLVNLHIVRRVALSQANIWSSDVAIGLLRVRGACKRERGDGGWKKAICGHHSVPSASSSVGASQP